MSLSPLDLERDFGLVGGDIMHGALSLDQFLPRVPCSAWRLPQSYPRTLHVRCRHPSGRWGKRAPGHNAAREMLKDLGKGAPEELVSSLRAQCTPAMRPPHVGQRAGTD